MPKLNSFRDLAERLKVMQRYCQDFHTPMPPGTTYGEIGFYPREATMEFVEWMKGFTVDQQVGILMILRRCQISHHIFLRDDVPGLMEWYDELQYPLSLAMGGRLGNVHSGRRNSPYPVEDES